MLLYLLLALNWSMAEGAFLGQPGAEFAHLKIGPDKALRITLKSGAMAEGVYAPTMNKFAGWHVSFRVKETAGPFKANVESRLTLQFECAQGHEQVQLCLHGATDEPPKVLCEVLISAQTCTQAPPTTAKPLPAGEARWVREAPNAPNTLFQLNPAPDPPQKKSFRPDDL